MKNVSKVLTIVVLIAAINLLYSLRFLGGWEFEEGEYTRCEAVFLPLQGSELKYGECEVMGEWKSTYAELSAIVGLTTMILAFSGLLGKLDWLDKPTPSPTIGEGDKVDKE